MPKSPFWRRFVLLQPLQPLLSVDTPVEALLSQSRGTVEALASTIVRCISLLKPTFFTLLSRGCRDSFPNSSQESHFPDSWELGDEFDYSDYADWYEDMCNETGIDDREGHEPSWEQQAVDEAIDEEQPGQYPPGDSSIGDIPF